MVRATGHGEAAKVVPAGEAIDRLLEDATFVKWLETAPATTWSTANVLLINYGEPQGIVPGGPSWELDLFREHNAPRSWAIGFVDPFEGILRSLTLCSDPCDH